MMAKFRDSAAQDVAFSPLVGSSVSDAEASNSQVVHDRSIGDIIADTRSLGAEQVEQILKYQREHGVRFGEAAVALGFATTEDVLFALSQQFHYPYAPEERRNQNPELVALNQPFSPQAEAFRAARSQLMMRLYSGSDTRPAVAIVSPDSGDGKTYFAANLAVTLAQLGGRTLLVDADMRGPRQHEVFGIPNEKGLSGILSGRSEQQVIHQVPGIPSLFILPVGVTPPNPLELVERSAFGLLMRELAAKFDHVIVDTPAGVYGTDGSVIASRCGAAVIVVRRDTARVAVLQDLVEGLAGTPAKLGGVIFNEY